MRRHPLIPFGIPFGLLSVHVILEQTRHHEDLRACTATTTAGAQFTNTERLRSEDSYTFTVGGDRWILINPKVLPSCAAETKGCRTA